MVVNDVRTRNYGTMKVSIKIPLKSLWRLSSRLINFVPLRIIRVTNPFLPRVKCGDFTDKISISKISTTDISVSFFDSKKELIRPSRGFEFNFSRRRRPVLSNRRTSIPPSIHFNIITKKVHPVLTEKIRSGESTCQNSVKKFGRLVHIAYVYTCIQPGDACFSLTRRNLFAQSLSDQRVKRAPGSYLLAVHFRVYRPRG